jgi:hypothetical protein
MTIKQQGGIFGRNPTFNDVDVDGNLNVIGNSSINGGSINNTVIGSSTPASITGTTGTFSGDLTVDTNTLYVDSANNRVGFGTSSPNNKLSMVDASGSCVLDMSGSNGVGSYGYATISTVLGSSGNGYGELTIGTSSASIVSERIRVPSSGGLLVGKTSGGSISVNGAELGLSYSMFAASNSGTTPTMFVGANGASGYLINFYYGSGIVGGISTNGTTTTYSTASDYRLKEDVQTMVGASDRVLALNPVNFAWKSDGTRVDGFLAHEAQAVVPEAVTGDKDAVDAEGNPEYQIIDQSKFLPLLTAALQEALGRIKTLEAEVAALKGQ